MRLDRLLAITVMLLNRDRIQARELSDHFEVSVRTIYRDIEAINLAGIPVISYQGNNGGFGIAENYKIDRQVLSLNDMCTILSALKGLNTTIENRQITHAIDKIHSLIPEEQNDQLKLFNEQFVIDILPWGYRPLQRAMLKTLHYAITENRIIGFTYTNTQGETLTRQVEPMTLIFKGHTWYLFAFCRIRQDFRLFRLSRMRDLALTEENFSRREESYTEYLDFNSSSLPWVDLQLKFQATARVRVEDYFEQEQITCQPDGTMLVEVSYPEDAWVYSLILSYGAEVEVLQPGHIRGIIAEKAKKIINLYQT